MQGGNARSVLEARDYVVGLEGRHDEVEEPEGEEKGGRNDLGTDGTTEFATDALRTSH